MADKDLKETEREETASAYNVVLKNCCHLHSEKQLPPVPYFLQDHNRATVLLQDMLKESEYDHRKFARKAAKMLVYYKGEHLKELLKKASLTSENIDVLELISHVQTLPVTPSTAEIKLVKAQSTRGPIRAILNVSQDTYSLEEGDSVKLTININKFFIAKFVLDDGNENEEFCEMKVFFKRIFEDLDYKSAIKKPEIEVPIYKKGKDFEVNMTMKVKVSKFEKLDVLDENHRRLTDLLNEVNEELLIFHDMQESLKVRLDEHDTDFVSRIEKVKNRECCSACEVI
jgi:hypothetical protein